LTEESACARFCFCKRKTKRHSRARTAGVFLLRLSIHAYITTHLTITTHTFLTHICRTQRTQTRNATQRAKQTPSASAAPSAVSPLPLAAAWPFRLKLAQVRDAISKHIMSVMVVVMVEGGRVGREVFHFVSHPSTQMFWIRWPCKGYNYMKWCQC
jgi:hypothetical protein